MRVKFNFLFEGTHHDTDAAKMLVKVGLFTEEEARKIIKDLHDNKIHAFSHANLKKYLKGIVRMCIDYANGDSNKAKEFLDKSAKVFDAYLTYIKDIRDKQEDQTAFDKIFMNQTTYDEVKDFVEKHQKELNKKSKDELSKMKFDTESDYELIPIDSYEEMNSQFGGSLTGNGTGDSSGWCHTNGRDTYNDWTNNGEKFFVLARKGWKDISFNPKTNIEMQGKDDYGNSLIAILVDKYGNLKKATLRCNHEQNIKNADNQYETFAELSKLVGFNVEDKIKELGNFEESPLKDGVYYYEGGEVPDNLSEIIKKVIVKEGVTRIGNYAFSNCTSLKSITIPNSVTSIERSAFYDCTSLKSITIPDSVTRIGYSAFCSCRSLKSITIPDGVTKINDYTFSSCDSLKSITIPDSVTEIGHHALTSKNTVVYCNEDSYAYWYCKAERIKVDTSRRI